MPQLKVELQQRQIDAINNWKTANRRGILAMATGTGKTIAALGAAASLENLDLIVVAAPTKEIVRQWVKEIEERTTFKHPLIATGKAITWKEPLYRKLRLLNRKSLSQERLPVIVAGTYGELSKMPVLNLIDDAGGLPANSILIADEVHGAGAKIYRQILREDFRYRLGLSATPIRPYDEEGTELVLEYFGGIVYEFSLEEAIAAGILCEYEYHVYVAELNDEEYFKFRELTIRISQLLNSDDEEKLELAKTLSIQRANIIKSASSKLDLLNGIIEDHPSRRSMIYCADIAGATAVSGMLAGRGLTVARYTSEDGDRPRLLWDFSRGNLDALVAVKCLDEGVDIPAADQAIILASDASERQFIQRRGRILRAAPKKSLAKVIDIIVVPPEGDYPLEIIDSEIKRVAKFARAASNRASLISKLVEEIGHYGISHLDLW